MGFDEEYLERIFASFERLHGPGTYEGTGMWLAICYRIVERHDGEITAEASSQPGAKFVVALPVKQTEVVSELVLPLKEELASRSSREIYYRTRDAYTSSH